jgi:hypothetical protein
LNKHKRCKQKGQKTFDHGVVTNCNDPTWFRRLLRRNPETDRPGTALQGLDPRFRGQVFA